jgi:hypothetical protein
MELLNLGDLKRLESLVLEGRHDEARALYTSLSEDDVGFDLAYVLQIANRKSLADRYPAFVN